MEQCMIRLFKKFLLPGLAMALFSAATVPAAEAPVNPANGKLSGQFMINGKTPLANGRLFLYNKAMGPPSSDRYSRVPDNITHLDNNGKFQFELEPGVYYLSAINVTVDAPMGPPADGEPIYFKMDAKGAIEPFVVSAGQDTNAGIISTSSPYRRTMAGSDKFVTLVEGIIIDADDKPVEGAVVLADNKPGTQNKALFVSEKTGRDGRFVLHVHEGGQYFLRARGAYHGGMPEAGDIINFNDPKEQITVTLKKGERLSGITIKVKRQPQKGPLFQGKPL
jgi:hypothetical protein